MSHEAKRDQPAVGVVLGHGVGEVKYLVQLCPLVQVRSSDRIVEFVVVVGCTPSQRQEATIVSQDVMHTGDDDLVLIGSTTACHRTRPPTTDRSPSEKRPADTG